MRIRKILPLVLLAVGTLFMLTSCDKLLDFIFASNTINVDTQVYAPNYPTWATSYVTATLNGASGSSYSAGPTYASTLDGALYAHYTFSFPKLSNDTYTLTLVYSGRRLLVAGPYYPGEYDIGGVVVSTGNSASFTMPYSSGNPSSVTVVGLYN